MPVDIEDLLARELREVVDGLAVPTFPALPRDEARRHRLRHTLLVAAVVLLIVAAALAMEAIRGSGRAPEPAPPSPTPSQREEVAVPTTIPTTAPTTTFELNRNLYAGGRQVPGSWVWAGAGGGTWIAWRDDMTWWWGRGAEASQIEGIGVDAPVVSPDGEYVAEVMADGRLNGFSTGLGGEGFGPGVPAESGVRVRAVLDDGRIIAQGAGSAVLWRPPLEDTIDLTSTAPGQDVRRNTSAGLVVRDGPDGAAYLAEISDAGRLTKLRDLPSDNVVVSPGTAWFAWTPTAPPGADIMRVPTLRAQSLDGVDEVRWTSPVGWEFRAGEWTWEDDEHLVSPVARDDLPTGERLARCHVRVARCVLIDSP